MNLHYCIINYAKQYCQNLFRITQLILKFYFEHIIFFCLETILMITYFIKNNH